MRLDADRFNLWREHVPVYRSDEQQSSVEHEASTSKISEEQLFYLQQRGISQEDAVSLIINGFCKDVFLAVADGVCS